MTSGFVKRHVGPDGLELIKRFEGYVGTPYRDPVGVWTIGYGHTEGVSAGSPHLTEPEASRLLLADLDGVYARAVNETGIPLTQRQFDATVSFVYNLGVGMLDPIHTFGADLHAHLYTKAADSMLLYDMAGGKRLAGLTTRREAERRLFLG